MKLLTLRRKLAENKMISSAQALLRSTGARVALGTAKEFALTMSSIAMWLIVIAALVEVLSASMVLYLFMLFALYVAWCKAYISVSYDNAIAADIPATVQQTGPSRFTVTPGQIQFEVAT